METIKAATRCIKKCVAIMPDDMKAEFKAARGDMMVYEAINNACGMINGSEEKEALLKFFAVQEANRAASTLWREGLITKELEEEYRKLPKQKEVVDEYKPFDDAREKRIDEIIAMNNAIVEEKKDLDIFKGVFNGMSKEQAERGYNDAMSQQMQAMGR